MYHGHQDRPVARAVGRVVGLWRYPVKSMAGEALAAADVSWHGLAGDRRWAFVRDSVKHSAFPWLTLRERGDMSRYQPSFLDPAAPETSRTMVRTPSGALLDVTAAALAAELDPHGARVIRQHRGIFDTFPLSLITTQTIEQLGALLETTLDVQRFRPNILVQADDAGTFPEDDWLGCVLRIGSLRLRIDERDGRCAVITIDPATSARAPAILRTVARERAGYVGVYASTVQPGHFAVGDRVLLD